VKLAILLKLSIKKIKSENKKLKNLKNEIKKTEKTKLIL